MSRCFPYPPPGYEAKHRTDFLVDPLKSEKEKAKKEEKEKKRREKREKKERRKQEKSREHEKLSEIKHSINERSKDKSLVNQEVKDHSKRKFEEIEQLERSNITEEHGPSSGIQGSYDSSDSSQSTAKRKIQDAGAHHQGSGLRIRLPLLKHKDSEPLNSKEQPFTSGRPGTLLTDPGTCGNSAVGRSENLLKVLATRKDNSDGRLGNLVEELETCKNVAVGRSENLSKEPVTCNFGAVSRSKSLLKEPETCKNNAVKSKIHKREACLRELLDSLPQSSYVIEDCDEIDNEWLSVRKHRCQPDVKIEVGTKSCLNVSGWPRACYLPAADVYALPFTVPY